MSTFPLIAATNKGPLEFPLLATINFLSCSSIPTRRRLAPSTSSLSTHSSREVDIIWLSMSVSAISQYLNANCVVQICFTKYQKLIITTQFWIVIDSVDTSLRRRGFDGRKKLNGQHFDTIDHHIHMPFMTNWNPNNKNDKNSLLFTHTLYNFTNSQRCEPRLCTPITLHYVLHYRHFKRHLHRGVAMIFAPPPHKQLVWVPGLGFTATTSSWRASSTPRPPAVAGPAGPLLRHCTDT